MDLEGLPVVVTGASGNLGAAVCKRLLADGARVAALVTRAESGDKLRAALGAGERVSTHLADLGSQAAAEAALAEAEARHGPLWGAVHTVGGWSGGKRVAEAEVADLDAMLAVNLRTAFVVAGAAMRRFAERRGGRLVTVAAFNVASGTRLAGNAAYAAAKAGLIALTRALAEEGAPLGIRDNCIAPDTLRTPQNAAAMPSADPSHWVSLEDAAAAIALLCSPACAANGSVLLVPG